MKKLFILFTAVLMSFGAFAKGNLPRTIVTTDGEIDDVDTFIRMLLYTNEFHVEGLVYSSSMWHYSGDGKGTLFMSEMDMTKRIYGKPRPSLRWPGVTWIQDLLEQYAKVYPNLILHSKSYPTPDYLKSLVKVGNIDFEGEMEKITDGSEWIKNKLMDETDNEEIYLQAWGGTNTIARALRSIEDENKNKPNWSAIKNRISKKAIIYTIMDQDATYKKYIGVNWPEIRVFYNANQFWCMAYPWKRQVPKSFQKYFEGTFMGPLINDHGPLLKKYYSYGDGQKQEGDEEHNHGNLEKITKDGIYKQFDFISEGDSPAFLNLMDTGLDNYKNPSFGGWGGRFVKAKDNPFRFEDGETAADLNPETGKMDKAFPQTRWLEAMQLDFLARAEWCIKPFEAANHAPWITVKEGTQLWANAGEKITLHVSAQDKDKNNVVQFKVWPYVEAGDGKAITLLEGNMVKVQIPSTAKKGDKYHVIVEGTDNGTPQLTRYRRVVINVL